MQVDPIDKARDRIRIDDLAVSCIVGILPTERHKAQTLVLSLEMAVDVEAAAWSGRLDLSVDYARVAAELAFVLETGRFRLLESAALALCHCVLRPPPGCQAPSAVTLSLRKPEALGGHGAPSLTVTRSAATGPANETGDSVLICRGPDVIVRRVPRGSPCAVEAGYAPPQDGPMADAGGQAWTLRVWTAAKD